MSKGMQALGFIIIFLGLTAIFVPIYFLYGQGDKYTIKKVPCYDGHQNKIIDIICEKKDYSGIEGPVMVGCFLGMILVFLGVWVYSKGVERR